MNNIRLADALYQGYTYRNLGGSAGRACSRAGVFSTSTIRGESQTVSSFQMYLRIEYTDNLP